MFAEAFLSCLHTKWTHCDHGVLTARSPSLWPQFRNPGTIGTKDSVVCLALWVLFSRSYCVFNKVDSEMWWMGLEMWNREVFISCRTPRNLMRPSALLLWQTYLPPLISRQAQGRVNWLQRSWFSTWFCLVISNSVFSLMVQKVPKDMVITAEIRLPAFAAIQTVKFHCKIPQSMCSILLQFSVCSLYHLL